MSINYGETLRHSLEDGDILCFIGVHDVFSATLAADHFDGLFVSGFSFAASYYGLPDIGFVAWPDIVAFVQRVRTLLPRHHIIVDIDDGYGDPEIAAHVVTLLESSGASAVITEDQKRPRRCGHLDGKQLLELDQYLEKLDRVLKTRQDLFVIARTDATSEVERLRRAHAFDAAGADAILVDGLDDLCLLRKISRQIERPLMFNQIAGGKSPRCNLDELKAVGVSLVNYSTPTLFAAQEAIDQALRDLKRMNGDLPDTSHGGVNVATCNAFLNEEISQRDRTGLLC